MLVTALRASGSFRADQVCAAHAEDPEWRADQLRGLSTAERHAHLWNETSVGNLLLLHARGTGEEQHRIEDALTAWVAAIAITASGRDRRPVGKGLFASP